MLINKQSPLRSLPSALNAKQTLYFDGIRLSIQMTDMAFTRLRDVLTELSLADTVDNAALPIPEVFSDAWAIIDNIHRLRGLIQQMPGLRQNRFPPARIFLDKTAHVEHFRNKIQHLNNELGKLAAGEGPTWGTVTWATITDSTKIEMQLCILVAGSLARVGSPEVVIPDLSGFSHQTDRIALEAHGASISLSDLMVAVEQLVPHVEQSVQSQIEKWREEHGEVPTAGADLFGKLVMITNPQEPRDVREVPIDGL